MRPAIRIVLRNLWRNPLRNLFTAFSVAFTLFACIFLQVVTSAWYAGAARAAGDRLVVRNQASMMLPLPLSYVERIKQMEGVADVSYQTWFTGMAVGEAVKFAKFAVDAPSFVRMFPEYRLQPNEREAFVSDPAGAIVGPSLAAQYGWKVGDRVGVIGDVYPTDFSFVVHGIYQPRDGDADPDLMFVHWSYLNDHAPEVSRDQVGFVLVRVSDPRRANAVAAAIDARFANSSAETRSESEQAFQLSLLSLASSIITAIQVVSAVLLLVVVLILANALAMSARERAREYAILRTLGFGPRFVVALVLGEDLLLMAIAFVIAVAIAPPVLNLLSVVSPHHVSKILGPLQVTPRVLVGAIGVALVGGLIAGLVPAWRSARVRLADAAVKLN